MHHIKWNMSNLRDVIEAYTFPSFHTFFLHHIEIKIQPWSTLVLGQMTTLTLITIVFDKITSPVALYCGLTYIYHAFFYEIIFY